MQRFDLRIPGKIDLVLGFMRSFNNTDPKIAFAFWMEIPIGLLFFWKKCASDLSDDQMATAILDDWFNISRMLLAVS